MVNFSVSNIYNLIFITLKKTSRLFPRCLNKDGSKDALLSVPRFVFVCSREAWQTHEALGCVVHDAQLEALLVLERLGQSAPQCIGRQNSLAAELELREDALQTHKGPGRFLSSAAANINKFC